jgi:hypothetical protein
VFVDPWNPSASEIRAWAYAPDADEPCQDWDLSLSWAGHELDYLEFIADQDCPKREFFLHVIYFMVGDAVRNGFRSVPQAIVRGFVERAANTDSVPLRVWYSRAQDLLRNPSEFEYASWCGGGLARTP